MKVNAVSFSAGRLNGTLSTNSSRHITYKEPKPRPADIIPISGLFGMSLICAYLLHKGQLDMFMQHIRF